MFILLRLSVERLLACQFLIQRMNRYCKLNANEMKDDAIYVAMMQIIAQLSFCRYNKNNLQCILNEYLRTSLFVDTYCQ